MLNGVGVAGTLPHAVGSLIFQLVDIEMAQRFEYLERCASRPRSIFGNNTSLACRDHCGTKTVAIGADCLLGRYGDLAEGNGLPPARGKGPVKIAIVWGL